MKQIAGRVVLLTAVLMVALGAAHADPGPVRFNVPFDFVVGTEVLPAGEYSVQPALSNRSDRILLRSLDGRTVTSVFTTAVKAQQASGETKLVFLQDGDRYSLSQLWTRGSAAGREVPDSSNRREAGKKEAEIAVVVAQGK